MISLTSADFLALPINAKYLIPLSVVSTCAARLTALALNTFKEKLHLNESKYVNKITIAFKITAVIVGVSAAFQFVPQSLLLTFTFRKKLELMVLDKLLFITLNTLSAKFSEIAAFAITYNNTTDIQEIIQNDPYKPALDTFCLCKTSLQWIGFPKFSLSYFVPIRNIPISYALFPAISAVNIDLTSSLMSAISDLAKLAYSLTKLNAFEIMNKHITKGSNNENALIDPS